MEFLTRYTNRVYSGLRIVTGLMFACHGLQKVFGILSVHPQPELFSQLWIGGVIELVAGTLVAIGFKTRYAAFLSSGTMAVAYIQFHWKFQFGSQFFPVINHGELALLYSILFLYIACYGSGDCAVETKQN